MFLLLNEPSAQHHNGDALVMQQLARTNPHSAAWDSTDILEKLREISQ